MENKKEDKKIRILALCDSPTAATGFAHVSKNVLRRLAKTGKYEIDVLGINYYGDYYDREQHPYNIYPACPQGYSDMYGRGRLLNAINGYESKFGLKPPWDIIFTIQDPFIIEGLGLNFPFADQLKVAEELWKRTVSPEAWFKWIGYFPVDATIKENWVTKSIALVDFPVAYCEWGLDQINQYDREHFELIFNLAMKENESKRTAKMLIPTLKDRISVIHHGVDIDVFKPLPKREVEEFKKEFFHGVDLKPDTYLVINVSRNQPRKDLARTMAAFAEFKKKVKNSHLYLHCKEEDTGGSIHEIARNFNLIPGEDYSCPMDFNAGVGYTVEVVNKIYNAADLCVTTTLGEGWGFITTEAMATQTPIVAPNISSILDIFDSHVPEGKDLNEWLDNGGWDKVRGVPVKAGSTSSEWMCLGLEDNERIRPLTNVEDLVSKMLFVYNNPGKIQPIVRRAYEWVQGLTWENITKQWEAVFDRAYKDLSEERALGRDIDKVGRNDPCPCKSGLKFKKCHGSGDKLAKFRDWIVQEGGEVNA